MSQIKRDRFGLYVIAQSWKSRPFYGTCFKEGDEVRTHHFRGSTEAGVGLPGKASFRRSRNNLTYEYWCTSGSTSKDKPDDAMAKRLRWYWDFVRTGAQFFAGAHNKSYASSVRRKHQSVYTVTCTSTILRLCSSTPPSRRG